MTDTSEAPITDPQNAHPWAVAEQTFNDAYRGGSTWTEAAGFAINSIARAAMRGDKRALVVDDAEPADPREALRSKLVQAGIEPTPEQMEILLKDS